MEFTEADQKVIMCEKSITFVGIQSLIDDSIFSREPYSSRELRHLLAALYPDVAKAKIVAADAGLEQRRIAWGDVPDVLWGEILREAEHCGQVDRLLQLVEGEYGDGAAVQTVLSRERRFKRY